MFLHVQFRGLSGDVTAAHLHNAPAGVNGPVVVDLTGDTSGRRINSRIRMSDVIGPLADADDPFLALLNELAAGNIYVNVHTAENPGGEIRGQVSLLR